MLGVESDFSPRDADLAGLDFGRLPGKPQIKDKIIQIARRGEDRVANLRRQSLGRVRDPITLRRQDRDLDPLNHPMQSAVTHAGALG